MRLPAHGRREAHELFIRRYDSLDGAEKHREHVRPGEPTEKSLRVTGQDWARRHRKGAHQFHALTHVEGVGDHERRLAIFGVRFEILSQRTTGQDAARRREGFERASSKRLVRAREIVVDKSVQWTTEFVLEYVSLSLAFTHVESRNVTSEREASRRNSRLGGQIHLDQILMTNKRLNQP